MGQGIACDPFGCTGRLADGARIAYALTADAFADDCQEAVLVIAARAAPPPGCAATVIGRDTWRTGGALALHRTASAFVIDAVRGGNVDRPWSPARRPLPANPPSAAGTASPRDATPKPEDLEADQ